MAADKIFISYSHDSPEHSDRVLDLSNALRKMGVDAELDRYHVRPPRGWPHWCEEQLRPDVSRFVLIICTAKYLARVEGRGPADEGRGVYWEGAIISSYEYDDKGSQRFIPILLGEEPESSVPRPLRGQTRYRLREFALGDEGYKALYRELTDQPEIAMPPLGPVEILTRGIAPRVTLEPATAVAASLPALEVRSTFEAAAPSARFDIDRIYAYAPEALIGREAETAVIAEAWEKATKGEAHPHVLTFVALGGGGKTSLIAQWANDMAARDWPGCDAAFAWSFYRQSSSEQAGASSDLFLAEALKFFRLPMIEGESGYEKGKRLAREIGRQRVVLILDGLEPLQYAPSAAHKGELKDDVLRALLRNLAQSNAGLCIITTRYRVEDLRGPAISQRDLAPLNDAAGAELLARLGVSGPEKERRKLSADVKGHALTMEIIGGYLREAHGGDVFKRDRVKLSAANVEEKGGRAFRAMAAYAEWFESAGEVGARALSMLRLIGLFDRPADAGCLAALWRAPVIEGLTARLVDLSDEQRNIVLTRLERAKLLTVTRGAGGALIEIDAHPLLREYFAAELLEKRPEAWREAHRRLYRHLTAIEDKSAPTLEDLQPLHQAITHGCAAGLWQEACEEVYHARICRRDEAYVVKKLGAFGADLSAAACFFEHPWRQVSSHLTPEYQAWLINEAGFDLRALGRLGEAREPMRAALEMLVAQENWVRAATAAGNLSELELTMGEISAAVRLGETCVAHADRSSDAAQRMGNRTTHADALHQAGRREAAALFAQAEAMQAQGQPHYPRLYSAPGFRYCDLLLSDAERAMWRCVDGIFNGAPRNLLTDDAPKSRDPTEVRIPNLDAFLAQCSEVMKRGRELSKWRVHTDLLLEIGLDHLTLARAELYAATLLWAPSPSNNVDKAVEVIRHSGSQHYLPLPLLTRSLQRAVSGDVAGARDDLDEAHEIAERGPMRLHLADIHLHRARLFGLLNRRPLKYPWISPQHDLAEARKLIEKCGYNRRLPELEDAEAALRG